MNITLDYDLTFSREDLFMGNKLFCTFTKEDSLAQTLEEIQSDYTILNGKIFVLYAPAQEEFLCTYNVDLHNVSRFPKNTILVHRKKESKTLYTINALNTLIKELTGGIADPSYKLDWNNYQNCVLLTKGPELRKISTSLYEIRDI